MDARYNGLLQSRPESHALPGLDFVWRWAAIALGAGALASATFLATSVVVQSSIFPFWLNTLLVLGVMLPVVILSGVQLNRVQGRLLSAYLPGFSNVGWVVSTSIAWLMALLVFMFMAFDISNPGFPNSYSGPMSLDRATDTAMATGYIIGFIIGLGQVIVLTRSLRSALPWLLLPVTIVTNALAMRVIPPAVGGSANLSIVTNFLVVSLIFALANLVVGVVICWMVREFIQRRQVQ